MEHDVGPELEERIRDFLPDEVKQFALEKSSANYSWISLYKSVRDRGVAETIRLIKQNNAVLQVEAYGPGYHHMLSPWREY